MNVSKNWFASVALFLSLTAGGAILAQDNGPNAPAEPAAPPVVVVPVVPQAGNVLTRDGSSRDWRDEIAADREAKGWGLSRPQSSSGSPRNRLQNYPRSDYYSGGEDRWARFRDPRDRSDRIGQNRSAFTPMRPDVRSDAEAQAQAYAALYWMMKAQAEQEQRQDRR